MVDSPHRKTCSGAVCESDPSAELPENVVKLAVSRRGWNGIDVDLAEWHGGGEVKHRFANEQKSRLLTVLDEVGGRCEPRLRPHQPCTIAYRAKQMDFAPARMELWGFNADARHVRDVTLAFDFAALSERIETKLDSETLLPKLRFNDDRVWTLVKMLSDVVGDQDPSAQLYGDGLTAAISARLFVRKADISRLTLGLTQRQLRLVIDRIEADLPNRVELAELASLSGLSQSHFSRAFKASTGMAPYQWQLDARIRSAKSMLANSRVSMAEVAAATGFADTMHFGRTFRKLTGEAPAAWRRATVR